MKLAVVVGHNKISQGAVRSDTGESEFVYNTDLAKKMRDIANDQYPDLKLKIFYRTPGGGYTSEIERVYAEVDQWDADASIELHFNSAGDPTASGTETFSSGSSKSVVLAQEVQMEMVEALDLRDRGVKIRNSRTRGRGYLSLISGRAPAILVEPFFASSSRGRAASDQQSERIALAEAIVEGAVRAMEQF